MTFYFGFATDDRFYLAADRRRIWKDPVEKVEDDNPKLHEVNTWTYLVGAGFMYFVDDVVAPQSPEAFGSRRIDTTRLAEAMPLMNEQLAGQHADVARQTTVGDPEKLFSQFTVAGINASGMPFSCDWLSTGGFQPPRVGGRHSLFLPRGDAKENTALRAMINELQRLAFQKRSLEDLAAGAQQVLAWVALRDESVSAAGDLVSIGPDGSKELELPPT
ncbi:hypothetical protein [Engelhardtia mirabilis]|uniref:Uncharacterized protein n=1 Tax=Engelhardtia mirabilis TaxID=2528011 RepID=A0A518BT74_9BACT|nr:hypothetical protein Pla133_53000 [Planctomycetes bacterium Pla133]QDV04506.1 hypothetical protein Pla86_53020 [Planctomycetes bacterium Pla86]